MKEVLKVDGMSCNHCVNAVKTGVGELAGISAVDVNLDAGEVAVDFDESKATLSQIKEAIEDQGFDVK